MEIRPTEDTLKGLSKVESEQGDELRRLSDLVDNFAKVMEVKLHTRARQGYRGWDDPKCKHIIIDKLVQNVRRLDKGDMSQTVEIANLAAFLWALDLPWFLKKERK